MKPRLRQGKMERGLSGLAWVCAVVLLTVGVALGARNELTFRSELVAQADAQARILAASLTAALSFDDRFAMRQYLAALRADARIAAAAVYGPDGARLMTSSGAGTPALPSQAGPLRTRWVGRRVEATQGVSEQGQGLGYVVLLTRPDPWTSLLARHVGTGLLTLMGLALLVLVSVAASQLEARAAALATANARLTDEMAARVKAEEALRQSQKMEALGQLTGGLAHDFNNLLQVIIASLELIRRKASDAEKVDAWATNALDAADRGAALTRQLLAFSRTQKLDLRPFVVAELVAGMTELLVRTLGPSIELVLDLDDTATPVLSDRTQLELAVLNLAINARDAMPGGGRLTIRTRLVEVTADHTVLEPDLYVALSVADTGEGMAPDVLARAFDPFFTTKSVGKGTGLGLSQVYGVARQAGGQATVESTPGQGTTVTVMLRRSALHAAARTVPAAAAGVLARAEGSTVLVVDDDAAVRVLLKDTLELLGYSVVQADSGPAALDVLKATRPDAVLLDFAMPRMNGAEVAAEARRLWPDLPIVFASGHSDTSAIRAVLGDDVPTLRKPFQMEALASALSAAVSRGAPPGDAGKS